MRRVNRPLLGCGVFLLTTVSGYLSSHAGSHTASHTALARQRPPAIDAPASIEASIKRAAARYGLSEELLVAVIAVESGFAGRARCVRTWPS